ncbi:MAG: hypothetical protein H0Z33_04975 [Bacillaceae bacterium]|nr:hypothetical protein [Bacillaceae bacterium]
MACIDDKGNLTTTAKKILNAVSEDFRSPEEIAKDTGLPLFKVRSSLRDMKSMGFVTESEEQTYKIEERARTLLSKS